MPNNSESGLAQGIVKKMTAKGLRLAIAESLTGGALAAAVVDVPGASAVLLGSVVAYDTSVKANLLGVDSSLLAQVGAVDAEVALQMARGAKAALASGASPASGAVIGLACTGVAGPDPQDGKPVGTVFIATDAPGGAQVQEFLLAGSRAEIRTQVVQLALEALDRLV